MVKKLHTLVPVAVGVCTPMYLLTVVWARSWPRVLGHVWLDRIGTAFIYSALPFATSLVLTATLTPYVMLRLRGPAWRQKSPTNLLYLALVVLLFTAAQTTVAVMFNFIQGRLAVLLYLPALLLVAFFWVTIPAAIVEGQRPIAAFARSFRLVRQKFWRSAAIVVGNALAYWALLLAFNDIFDPDSKYDTPVVVGNWAIATGYILFSSLSVLAAYHFIRREQEGLTTPDIGTIFD